MSKLGKKLIQGAKEALEKAKQLREHSGKCDRCDEPFLIWLDGHGLYCWKHYCEVKNASRSNRDA